MIDFLSNKAREIRKDIIEEVYYAQSGHPGGSLSIADIMAVLYFDELNIDENNFNKKERNRLVLSKGHCSPALYAALAEKGIIKKEELKNFRNIHSKLQGHPNMNDVPGVDMSSGSLGQGLSVADGMAISKKQSEVDKQISMCGSVK